ncbi:response regulator [Flavobacterium sp. LC2016-01]|uniref:response regulator n=1 Tax=Flavobacterium sp. LC2016-01 TaxID=2675876 RepID=UPI0012BB0012|nr:response regulator [Flavobacterium sp. LC2016-01]MTH16496.1 response regulator [Flavobacterium sp. LC2016-01]
MPLNTTFLLIEDNLIDQLVIRQLLKKVLFIEEIHIANNGEEALLWLDNNREINKPLIILLDIQMPFMNGFDFLKEYDKLESKIKNDTQIYVLSSTLDPDEIDEITKNKYVSKMLSKPFPIEEFKDNFYLNTTAS